MNDFFAALCSTVKAEKSLPNSIKENSKPLQMCQNMWKTLWKTTLENEPIQCTSTSVYVCFSQSVKNKLWKVCACSTKTLCFHGIQESAHLVFFT